MYNLYKYIWVLAIGHTWKLKLHLYAFWGALLHYSFIGLSLSENRKNKLFISRYLDWFLTFQPQFFHTLIVNYKFLNPACYSHQKLADKFDVTQDFVRRDFAASARKSGRKRKAWSEGVRRNPR